VRRFGLRYRAGKLLARLYGDSGSMDSAGILVEKDNETVSIHCWQKGLDRIPEKMGDSRFFHVTQGKTHVSSRIGSTDIGLATLNDGIEFYNRFIDRPGKQTQLLHSNMLKSNSIYMMDSFTTGRQGGMLCKGKRVISQEEREKRVDWVIVGKQKDLPGAGTYMAIVQGIFATSEPIIRARCCGSPVVRLVETTRLLDGISGEPSTPSTKGTPDIRGSPTLKR
jgi:hypothetical protein